MASTLTGAIQRLAGALQRSFLAIGQGTMWATLGTVLNQGSTLVSNICIANLLGKSVFGEFVIVLSTAQAAASLATLGIAYTATRYMAALRHSDAERASRLLALFSRMSWITAIGAAVILAASSSWIAGRALGTQLLGRPLFLAACSTLFTVRVGFLIGALSGLEAFRTIGLSGIVSGTAYVALTVGGAQLGGVEGAATGLCLSAALQCVVLTVGLHREKVRQGLTQRSRASFADERSLLLRFAVPAALSGISTVPVLWIVQALITRTPSGFAELAVYAAGLNLMTMVLYVPTVLNGVAMAWITRMQSVEGEAAFRSAFRTNVAVTLVTVTAALLFMAALGPTLLGFYGKDFRSGYGTLALLLAATIPEALCIALNQGLQARERMWEALLGINLPRDIVIACAAVLLIPRYGAMGAACAYFSGRLVAFCIMLYLVRHEISGQRALA